MLIIDEEFYKGKTNSQIKENSDEFGEVQEETNEDDEWDAKQMEL